MTESYTLRTQLDYRLLFGEDSQHMFSAMGGFEMNGNVTKQNSDQIFGYLKDRGMQIVSGIDLNDFPDYRDKWLNVNHKKRTHSINHELSGYVTLGYSYKQHFTLNANARTDASNAFGSRAKKNCCRFGLYPVCGMRKRIYYGM